jgi:hypothetical protein
LLTRIACTAAAANSRIGPQEEPWSSSDRNNPATVLGGDHLLRTELIILRFSVGV